MAVRCTCARRTQHSRQGTSASWVLGCCILQAAGGRRWLPQHDSRGLIDVVSRESSVSLRWSALESVRAASGPRWASACCPGHPFGVVSRACKVMTLGERLEEQSSQVMVKAPLSNLALATVGAAMLAASKIRALLWPWPVLRTRNRTEAFHLVPSHLTLRIDRLEPSHHIHIYLLCTSSERASRILPFFARTYLIRLLPLRCAPRLSVAALLLS